MSKRRLVFFTCIGLTILFIWSIWLAVNIKQQLNSFGGPLVQIGDTDGCTAIVIAWRTAEPSSGRLDYGLTSAYGLTATDNKIGNRHEIVLKNLMPATQYHYRIIANDKILASAIFQTGKIGNKPFKFAVFGDSGSGNEHQYAVAKQIEQEEVDFILHTGDLIYNKGEDSEYPRQFYLPYKNLIAKIPFFPTLGNHDYKTNEGQPWLDNFVLPDKERFYSFNYANAHFVALDSNRVDEDSVLWLEKDLSQNKQLWKFIFFHHPPFSNKKGRDGNALIRKLWHPVFTKYKVDVVFCGHDHIYTRFKPVDGVIYITEGVGGKSLYRSKRNDLVEFTDNRNYGFDVVIIIDRQLFFAHRTDKGKVLDTFILNK